MLDRIERLMKRARVSISGARPAYAAQPLAQPARNHVAPPDPASNEAGEIEAAVAETDSWSPPSTLLLIAEADAGVGRGEMADRSCARRLDTAEPTPSRRGKGVALKIAPAGATT